MTYVLVCRLCGDGNLVMPFESAAARGKWASGHTRGTGHDQWFVKDLPDAGEADPGNRIEGIPDTRAIIRDAGGREVKREHVLISDPAAG